MKEEEIYAEARKKLAARFGDSTRLGGKGTQKRKVKVVHKAETEDKKVRELVKKVGAQPMPDIVEMNFFHNDSTVSQFKNPEVFISFPNQVIVLSGQPEVKPLKDCIADVIQQVPLDQLELIKKSQGTETGKTEDEVPKLVNFEEAAKN